MPSDNIINVDTLSFEQQVLGHHGAVLVDFTAEWCVPCQLLSEVVHEVARHFGSRLRVAVLDVDQDSQLTSLFGISAIPYMILLHHGKIVRQWTGYVTQALLIRDIESALMENPASVITERKQ